MPRRTTGVPQLAEWQAADLVVLDDVDRGHWRCAPCENRQFVLTGGRVQSICRHFATVHKDYCWGAQ